MRHLTLLSAALLGACLLTGLEAKAAPPLPTRSAANEVSRQAETVGHCRYRHGLRPCGYYGPYRDWGDGYPPYRRYGWRYQRSAQ
jgi:hypothetical protein